MKLSAILEPLVAAGVDAKTILATVKAWETQQLDALEKRREADRNRQSRRRGHVMSRDVTVTVSSRARGEDNLQGKVISGEKEKKEASPSARPSRGTRIPDDFQPDIEAAVSEGVPCLEAERQARSFCDYWRSKPGKDGLKLDWPATWRVWYRRSIPSHSPPRHAAAPPNGMERMNRLLDEMQGKTSEQPPTIETGFKRTDSGSTASLVQLHAFASRR